MHRLILPVILLGGLVFADEPDTNRFLNTDVFELEVAADPRSRRTARGSCTSGNPTTS